MIFNCFNCGFENGSKEIQNRVWKYYRPGQCDDKKPFKEWIDAANDAIDAVWRFENET